ncbi:MAG: acyl-CoA dehydrogenase [Frondihabitans sp.]|nr:acyl-CoA dehydrogenase [Frondihabitans sp.]
MPSEITLDRHDERDLTEKLAARLPEIAAEAAANDEHATLPEAQLRWLSSAGFDAALLPEHLGGGGSSFGFFGHVVRSLAASDPALATVWVMHVGAGVGLAELTAQTLPGFFARAVLAGDRFANALSEPSSGNRFLNPQQEAEAVLGGYVIHGAKRFVSGSEIADHLLVNVAIGGEPAFFGIEPDPTVTLTPIWDSLGLRGTRSQLLGFDGTFLPAERRGLAGVLPRNLVGAGLPGISLGIASATLAALVAHARGRTILGRPLAEQQWVLFAAAEQHSHLEAATEYWAAALAAGDEGRSDFNDRLLRAKFLANRVAVSVAELAVRVGGGSGFLRTSPIQRHLRDAQAGQLMAYSTEVLMGVIGRQVLGLDDEPEPADVADAAAASAERPRS